MYLRPRTLDEAVAALGEHRLQVLAGGTDVYPALGERQPGPLLDVTAIQELKGIHEDAHTYGIGGLTTWSEILSSALPSCFDALKSAAREIGSVQIQNRGTIAGNLCNASPAADGVPPLLNLNAEVELASRRGRRRLALAEFILGNRRTARQADELLVSVIVPRGQERAKTAFVKLGARRYLVISIAMVAALVDLDECARVREARVAVGSCSVRARRLKALEESLRGAPAGQIASMVSARHFQELSPIDDVRATSGYRRDAAVILVRRALAACLEVR